MKTLINALIMTALLPLCACSLQPATSHSELSPVMVKKSASLIKSKKEMHDSTQIYSFPFEIESNNQDASLSLDFVVIDMGHCPVSYQPTTVSVNGQLVDEIDFRDFDYQERYKFDIPISKQMLVAGRNKIEIVTGECSYDIDDMVMNDLKITLQ